jgi:hypothetical protein
MPSAAVINWSNCSNRYSPPRLRIGLGNIQAPAPASGAPARALGSLPSPHVSAAEADWQRNLRRRRARKPFIIRCAPRPAASLALHATGVALLPTVRDTPPTDLHIPCQAAVAAPITIADQSLGKSNC